MPIIIHCESNIERELVNKAMEMIVKHEPDDTIIAFLDTFTLELLNTKIDFIDYGPDCTHFTLFQQACCKGTTKIIRYFLNRKVDKSRVIVKLHNRLDSISICIDRSITDNLYGKSMEELYKNYYETSKLVKDVMLINKIDDDDEEAHGGDDGDDD